MVTSGACQHPTHMGMVQLPMAAKGQLGLLWIYTSQPSEMVSQSPLHLVRPMAGACDVCEEQHAAHAAAAHQAPPAFLAGQTCGRLAPLSVPALLPALRAIAWPPMFLGRSPALSACVCGASSWQD